jgi:hypothetical protein
MSGERRLGKGELRSFARAALALTITGLAAQGLLVACGHQRAPLADEGVLDGNPPNLAAGPCVEGTTRACHQVIGQFGGVLSCFAGTQRCARGVWGACGTGGSGETASFESVLLPGGELSNGGPITSAGASGSSGLASGVRPQSLSVGSADGSPCSTNPCDPTCIGFNEQPGDGGINVGDADLTSAWLGPPFTGTVPPGFFSKGMIDCSQNNVSCESYVDGVYAACQFDTYCKPGACSAADASSGSCVEYAEHHSLSETAPGRTCLLADGGQGVDLTAGIACTDATDGSLTFTVCNRGSVDSAATTIGMEVFGGNSSAFPPSPPCVKNASPNCKIPLPALKAGTCFTVSQSSIRAGSDNLNKCKGYMGTGNVTVRVNADAVFPECRLNPSPYTDAGGTGGTGCENNWTDLHKSGGVCVLYGKKYNPRTYTQRYVADCGASTRAQWSLLSYNVTTPSSNGTSSSVKFEVRTAPKLADGDAGTFSSYVQAALAPSPDPVNCPMSGGDAATCPKVLYTILGGATGAASNDILDLQVTLTPTADQQIGPVLNSWQVTYSCPPTQ